MQSEVNQEENLNTTDFDEHFAKISSYIVDTLRGVPLEMTEDEKEQFRMADIPKIVFRYCLSGLLNFQKIRFVY